jgi:hypothetical protein
MHIVSSVKQRKKFKMRNKSPLRMEGPPPAVLVLNAAPRFSVWGKQASRSGASRLEQSNGWK